LGNAIVNGEEKEKFHTTCRGRKKHEAVEKKGEGNCSRIFHSGREKEGAVTCTKGIYRVIAAEREGGRRGTVFSTTKENHQSRETTGREECRLTTSFSRGKKVNFSSRETGKKVADKLKYFSFFSLLRKGGTRSTLEGEKKKRRYDGKGDALEGKLGNGREGLGRKPCWENILAVLASGGGEKRSFSLSP